MINRKTKLLATIGPASANYETLKAMYLAGANAFRLNFSHGKHSDHQKVIDLIMRINEELKVSICMVADLQGPKLRIADLKEPIFLKEGHTVTFSTLGKKAPPGTIPVSFKTLALDVREGEQIMIDDGKLDLLITSTNGIDEVKAIVVNGGMLKSRKGFNLPDTNLNVPSLTKKDRKDLAFILSQPFDWIALSFIRGASDITDLRTEIAKVAEKKHVKIIAKIEKPEAVHNLDAIIEVTDAVMIARGDLGVEIPYENVPLIQKRIIKRCIESARPVIIATQMMESMIDQARPTRAEVTDVANGVTDGADALMLSGETSVGEYPVEVVRSMDRIIRAAEKDHAIYHKNLLPDETSRSFLSDAICFNACKMAEDVEARAINGMTFSGYTAFMISSYRPKSDIYIFTSNKAILSTLNLLWGVEVFHYDRFVGTDETIDDVIKILRVSGKIDVGDIVINTASMPITRRGRTNMIKITLVKD